jgi:hypothetical protein
MKVEPLAVMSPSGTGHPEKQPALPVCPVKTKVAVLSNPEPCAVKENPPATGGEGWVKIVLNCGAGTLS